MIEVDRTREGGGAVLLFSGGRDSTIAALRIAEQFQELVLVTVTSPHLVRLDQVKKRLVELKRRLPPATLWIHATVAEEDSPPVVILPSTVGLAPRPPETCLPCHNIYFQIALAVAKVRGIQNLAAGYTRYQSHWLEQSAYACDRVKEILQSFGISFLLPVYDLASKDEARSRLREAQLSGSALEQNPVETALQCFVCVDREVGRND